MDSYMETQYHEYGHRHGHGHEHEQHPSNSGLLRFRSAPSSVFSDVTQGMSLGYEVKPQRLNLNSQDGFSGSGLGLSQLPPQYPKPALVRTGSVELEQSLRPGSGGSDGGGGGGLILNRLNSSPAGFFSHLNPQNGCTMMRGLGSFRVGNGTNGESSPRTSRLSMSHLPQIPEIGNENDKVRSSEGMNFSNREDEPGVERPTEFLFASWNGSVSVASDLCENGGLATRPNVLSHHLSLPKTSAEMAAVEKLMHFQETVPWKVRAKRGCATHPRSIAERERRNRISERMKKLQDLVPNMDKQTNTADMLDFAVDYIKNLQNQYKVLSDNRAKCKCVNVKHPITNQAI